MTQKIAPTLVTLPPRAIKARALCALFAWLTFALASSAHAAPEAHLLRIDPRASVVDNAPVLTTVVELVQHKSMSSLTSECAAVTGNAELSCMSERLEKPKALYDSFKFPEKNAIFTVTVDGRDQPATLVSVEKWGKSKSDKSVGTAWLLLVDASGGMGARFEDAKRIAKSFVSQAGPNDIIDVMFFNDRSIVRHSKWTPKKDLAANFIDSVHATFPAQGRSKQLFSIVKQGVTDAFRELGNVGESFEVPLHQTTVLISDGNTGTDVGSAAPTTLQLRQYLTGGRFPEDNTTLPKMPMPVISIWMPNRATEEIFQNARQFMENLANPEIGGAFFVVQGGEAGKGDNLARAVNTRFDDMYIVKWRVACLSPTISQTMKLVFKAVNPPIAGDNCNDCPLGIDPTQWPLDIDYAATEAHAKKNKVHPEGTVKIFGNFCWGTEYERAELYMVPKDQPVPASLKGKSIKEAQEAQQTLIRAGMKGKATGGGDTFIEFDVPETKKFLTGTGDKLTARLIIYDSHVKRTSPVTDGKVLTLPAEEKPLNLLLIGGLTFGGVVLILLVVGIFRSGSSRKRRGSGAAPPRPVVAGAGAAPQPGGFGAPPLGGGPPMGGAPMGGAPMGGAPMGGAPMGGAPMGAMGGAPMGGAPMMGPMGAAPMVPQGAPMGGMPANPTRAVLHGTPGSYPVTPGRELKVGRDPGLCDVCLTEPRISGIHATVKFEGGQLMIRDEGSNNGTYVAGGKIQSYAWVAVPAGQVLRFGPIEFTVRLE
jgi:hypothetical protein